MIGINRKEFELIFDKAYLEQNRNFKVYTNQHGVNQFNKAIHVYFLKELIKLSERSLDEKIRLNQLLDSNIKENQTLVEEILKV